MELTDIQEKIKKFTTEKEMTSKVEVRVIDIASEVGELSKEVLKGTDYGNKQFSKTKDWNCEIGDVFFSLICIANETETNLEECLSSALDKYEQRFNYKGHLGSD
ncbi:MazG nucleotide pyrophosphohydrolase domain-containing protein [Alkaliphilus peptidifermentans]|uniref:MazG nucleotide pyrophosphohydrolase domain-containing protein n=1 Tax=Alkaliphilus peptidifermentans DSM 18978 TaxID=1120976 RepID=A0A1G5CYU1_9FIRM|nr:MazG nucleotide pyrophosphohydrolase domain-containing protein [Alkaliphilus peptidifermentans]SCY07370.1 MazG nucleotide pyrophosphohydrolase domain-containing protein [Alkaliphilus peptidifermentans DSM 18978]